MQADAGQRGKGKGGIARFLMGERTAGCRLGGVWGVGIWKHKWKGTRHR